MSAVFTSISGAHRKLAALTFPALKVTQKAGECITATRRYSALPRGAVQALSTQMQGLKYPPPLPPEHPSERTCSSCFLCEGGGLGDEAPGTHLNDKQHGLGLRNARATGIAGTSRTDMWSVSRWCQLSSAQLGQVRLTLRVVQGRSVSPLLPYEDPPLVKTKSLEPRTAISWS